MQTHDEGEPWLDYRPTTMRPTADPVLAKMQYDYARLREVASALLAYLQRAGAQHLGEWPESAMQGELLIARLAALLHEDHYP